ncbi:unnamed protein product [Musa textilis]
MRAGRSTTGSHGTPYLCRCLLVSRFLPSLSVVSVGKL